MSTCPGPAALAPRPSRQPDGQLWPFWEHIDWSRRRLGEALDALGLGPIETPSRVLFAEAAVTLRAYGAGEGAGPAILLVPAPIKAAYVWDLAPRASVVRQCLRAGLRTHLVQWQRPGADEQGFGLAEYADRLILDCLQAIESEGGGRRAFLAGHSLGGTLAAIFASLHPERVAGLVLLGAPLHFGPDVGDLGPLVAIAPPARSLTRSTARVPGSALDVVSALASPWTFEWSRWLDWLASLPDARARETHLRVERWALDEMPLARQLFEDVVELLYREDRLMRGSLSIGGRRVGPELLVAPLLSVLDARCRVVPPESVVPYVRAAGSAQKRLIWYEGDVGVALQHVGMLVGENAHRRLWPEVLRWVRQQG